MEVTYSYSEPVGGATMMQVVYDNGSATKVLELEAVFVDGVYDANATQAVVAAEVETVFAEPEYDGPSK